MDFKEKKLKEYEELFKKNNLVYFKADKNGVLLDVGSNISDILGYDVEDLVGQSIPFLSTDPSKINRFLDEISLRGEVSNYRINFAGFDGKRKIFDINAKYDSESKDDIYGTLQDVSLEEFLRNVKTDMLAGGLHDLKNTLNVIKPSAQLLESASPEDYKDITDMVLLGINKQESVIKNSYAVLNMLDTGTFFTPQRFSPYAVAQKELNDYKFVAGKKKVSLKNNIPKDTFIHANQQVTEFIINNLIDNAIKYTSSGGCVGTEYEEIGNEEYVISIKDTGVGMTEEQISILGKNRIRSSPGTNNELGSGRAYQIMYSLSSVLNMYLSTESEPGKGSKINLHIPIPKKNS